MLKQILTFEFRNTRSVQRTNIQKIISQLSSRVVQLFICLFVNWKFAQITEEAGAYCETTGRFQLEVSIYLAGFSKRCSLKLCKKTSLCHKKP